MSEAFDYRWYSLNFLSRKGWCNDTDCDPRKPHCADCGYLIIQGACWCKEQP